MLPTTLNIALIPSNGGTATTVNPVVYTPPPITLYQGQPKVGADPVFSPNNVPAVISETPINPTLTEDAPLLPTVGIPIISGNILPTETYYSQNNPNFIPYWKTVSSSSGGGGDISISSISSLLVSTLTASTISAIDTFTNTLSTGLLYLDGQTLTANPYQLLLNGTALPNTSTLSTTIAEWSYSPAISTVNMNYNDIINTNLISTVNIITDTANINDALISSINTNAISTLNLNASNANISSINANAISTFNLNAEKAYISSIDTNTISTFNLSADKANIKQAVFSSIDAYEITTDYLTVNSTTINLFEFSTVFAEANIAIVDALTVNTINGQSYPPPAINPTLADVLNNGNVANQDIDMNDFDISAVNDITMSGLAPTITATNLLGNLTLSALGTFNALTGGQMTLASGGILSLGGASYTTMENLKINNSAITKDGSVADLTFDNVASISNTTSGASLGLGANDNVDITAGTAVNVYKSGGALLQMGTSASDTNKLALSYNSGTSELSFNKNLVGTAGNALTLNGTSPLNYNLTVNNASAQIGGRLNVNGHIGNVCVAITGGALDMTNNNISNVGTILAANGTFTNAPVLAQPAGYFTNPNQIVNKAYADSLILTPGGQISTFSTLTASTMFASIAAFSTVSISSLTAADTTFINAPVLAQPAGYFTNANQIVNKAYADSLVLAPQAQISTFSTLVASTFFASIAGISTVGISSLTAANETITNGTFINAPVLAQPASYFTTVNQLVNKGYADSIISTSRNAIFSTLTTSTISGNVGTFSTMGISTLTATNATFVNAPVLAQPAPYFTTVNQVVNKGYADSIISTSRNAIFSTILTSTITANVGSFSTMGISSLTGNEATFVEAPIVAQPANYFGNPNQLVNKLYVDTLFMGGQGIQATGTGIVNTFYVGNTLWRAHTFLYNGVGSGTNHTITITNPGAVPQYYDVFAIAGGGSGGTTTNANVTGGAGGAGMAVYLLNIPMLQTASYPQTWSIFVGSGGASQTTLGSSGNVGNNTILSLPADQTTFGQAVNITCMGGGGGASSSGGATIPLGGGNAYRTRFGGNALGGVQGTQCGGGGSSGVGGFGGGGGVNATMTFQNGMLSEEGTLGGFAGGARGTLTGQMGSGGGGIRSIGGGAGSPGECGEGGMGISFVFDGNYRALGGGGQGARLTPVQSNGNVGRNYGGGLGSISSISGGPGSLATAGAPDTGAGGGGANLNEASGAGGSGILMLRYRL